MNSQKIGILNPGEMRISIAASAQNSGHLVYWASEGRSVATRARAERYGLKDAGSLINLCAESSLMISVCPPHAAETVADQVLACHFSGLYLDVNAISPERVKRMDQILRQAGITLVDGGIIGGPAWEPNKTILYLSGPRAEEIAACFSQGPLEIRILDSSIGTASALKICYSAYSKGTTALLCAVLAAAKQLDVYEALAEQWDRDEVGFTENTTRRVRMAAKKDWRLEGEMEEIASTFLDVGLPGEFHSAAAEIYHRLAGFKDSSAAPPLEEVIDTIMKRERNGK